LVLLAAGALAGIIGGLLGVCCLERGRADLRGRSGRLDARRPVQPFWGQYMGAFAETTFLEAARSILRQLAQEQGWLDENVLVRAGLLTPEQAIGTPLRKDFPILAGKEKVIEARVQSARGHAFTDSPAEFQGTLREMLDRPLHSNADRALFVATLNAALRHLGWIAGALHCRDDDPEKCGLEIARLIREKKGTTTVGLIGCNPAVLEALVREFGADRVRLTDLNPDNIGTVKHGVEVWDGTAHTERLIREADVLLVTGTTFVNNTFPPIWRAIRHHGRDYWIYGVTAAGLCHLFGLNRVCPFGRDT
ncbi:MAG: DUF364 domain-containing protein, partial [Candidatus Sumerlaeia bacterium]|nr:DUF364 domain-containing protein [Candidatus Sumerlaeia bacterium]